MLDDIARVEGGVVSVITISEELRLVAKTLMNERC